MKGNNQGRKRKHVPPYLNPKYVGKNTRPNVVSNKRKKRKIQNIPHPQPQQLPAQLPQPLPLHQPVVPNFTRYNQSSQQRHPLLFNNPFNGHPGASTIQPQGRVQTNPEFSPPTNYRRPVLPIVPIIQTPPQITNSIIQPNYPVHKNVMMNVPNNLPNFGFGGKNQLTPPRRNHHPQPKRVNIFPAVGHHQMQGVPGGAPPGASGEVNFRKRRRSGYQGGNNVKNNVPGNRQVNNNGRNNRNTSSSPPSSSDSISSRTSSSNSNYFPPQNQQKQQKMQPKPQPMPKHQQQRNVNEPLSVGNLVLSGLVYPENVRREVENYRFNNFTLFLLEKNVFDGILALEDLGKYLNRLKMIENKHVSSVKNTPRSYNDLISELSECFMDIERVSSQRSNNSELLRRNQTGMFSKKKMKTQSEKERNFGMKMRDDYKTPIMSIVISSVPKPPTKSSHPLSWFSVQYESICYQNPCRVNYLSDASYLLKVKLFKSDCNTLNDDIPEFFNQRREALTCVLQSGLSLLCGKNFEFLNPPTSGPKSKICYFYQRSQIFHIENLLFNCIRTKAGSAISDPMKMMKRRALNFTKVIPTVVIPKEKIRLIPDRLQVDLKFPVPRNFPMMGTSNVNDAFMSFLYQKNPVLHNQVFASGGQILKAGLGKYMSLMINGEFEDKYILNFTDGSGLIGVNLMKRVMRKFYGDESLYNDVDLVVSQNGRNVVHPDLPSVIQIRFMGCKGTLVLDARKANTDILQIRESQVKFDLDIDQSPDHFRMMEIHSLSRAKGCAKLNTQLVQHLEERGVPAQYFIDLQLVYFQEKSEIFKFSKHPTKKLLHLLKSLYRTGFGEAEVALRKLLIGFEITEPTFRHNLNSLASAVLDTQTLKKNHKRFVKIDIPDSRYFFGIPDYLNVMNENEIFVQMHSFRERRTRVLTGSCVIAKMPIVHPRDIILVKAVDRSDVFGHLKECIVFNVRGKVPLSVKASRSDYDGDEFMVIYDPKLVKYLEMAKDSGIDDITKNSQRLSQWGKHQQGNSSEFQTASKLLAQRQRQQQRKQIQKLNPMNRIQSQFQPPPPPPNQQQQQTRRRKKKKMKKKVPKVGSLPTKNLMIETFVKHNGLLLSFYSDLLVRYIDNISYKNDDSDVTGELYSLIQELLDMKKDSHSQKKHLFKLLDMKLEVPDFLAEKYSKRQMEKKKVYQSSKILGVLYRRYLEYIVKQRNYHLSHNVQFQNISSGISLSKFEFLQTEIQGAVDEIVLFQADMGKIFKFSGAKRGLCKSKIVRNYRERFDKVLFPAFVVDKRVTLFYYVVFHAYSEPVNYKMINVGIARMYIDYVIRDLFIARKNKQNNGESDSWVVSNQRMKII